MCKNVFWENIADIKEITIDISSSQVNWEDFHKNSRNISYPLIDNVAKWSDILQNPSANDTRFLKSAGPIWNTMHYRVTL